MDVQKTRINISSNNYESIDEVYADIVHSAKGLGFKIRGPMRVPTKVVNITTSIISYGEGTNVDRNFKMRVYQRMMDILYSPEEFEQQIIPVVDASDVNIDVTVVTSVNGRVSLKPWQPVLSLGVKSFSSA